MSSFLVGTWNMWPSTRCGSCPHGTSEQWENRWETTQTRRTIPVSSQIMTCSKRERDQDAPQMDRRGWLTHGAIYSCGKGFWGWDRRGWLTHSAIYTVEGDPEDGTFKLRPEGKEAAMGKVEQAEGQHVWRVYTGTGLFSSGNERWLPCVWERVSALLSTLFQRRAYPLDVYHIVGVMSPRVC